jgi:transcriptional regulator
MHVPAEFGDDRRAPTVETIRRNPLALVVTGTPDGPMATHAPVVFPSDADTDTGDDERLVGATLLGHMNVQNPQWAVLCGGARVLLVFQGPHGYVSPTVYGVTPAAPTWNFTAVHLVGTVRPTTDRDTVLGVVQSTVRQLESRFGNGWDMTTSVGYFRQLAPGVGAFEFRIESVQSMFKLSQDQSPRRQQRVIEQFAASPAGTHRELAALMRDRGLGEPAGERGAGR